MGVRKARGECTAGYTGVYPLSRRRLQVSRRGLDNPGGGIAAARYAVRVIRRHHYEQAFEAYLRARRIPYVAVSEARKALLPEGAVDAGFSHPSGAASLKNFDVVVYGEGSNLLVEVKGRRLGRPRMGKTGVPGKASARMECWATLDDIESLRRWGELFGPGFEPALVFVYWCETLPPDALFEEIFEHAGRWYAIRAVAVKEYAAAMKLRSPRWRTVHVSPKVFEELSGPLAGVGGRALGPDRGVGFEMGVDGELPPLPAMERLVPQGQRS